MNDAWTNIEIKIRQASRKQCWHAIVLSLIMWGGVLIIYFAVNRHDPMSMVIAAGFAGIGLMIVLSSIYFVRATTGDMIDILKNEPENVIWVYYHKMEHLPFGLKVASPCTLIVGDQNGYQRRLQIPERFILEIMDELKGYLPNAVFGYSRYKEQLYNTSPSLLSKERDESSH